MARKRYLDGLEKVNRVFKQLPRENRERIAHALNLGAKEVRDDAEILVPVGDYGGAGDLKRSIDIEARSLQERADGKAVVAKVVAGTTPETATAARRQEFGRLKGPKGHPGHRPQPFMFPAYWANRKRIRSRIQRAIRDAVKAMRNV